MNYELSASEQVEYKMNVLEFKIEQLHTKLDETSVVDTSNGKIKGAKRRALYGEKYYSFERIPYAQPPIDELRFREPKPVANWKDVLDCTHYGDIPFQRVLGDGSISGSEDCLYLNVYTKNLKPKKPRPVMIWIYGGGFMFGEATREWHGPDYFMQKDIVLVTVQYRLGALGFLSLSNPDLHIPGNAGLKDQIMAIKWVKRNCMHFGGNPDCITVFGESAGGVSTGLLMATEQTKELFHRAILQSGTLINDWVSPMALKQVHGLAEAAGYNGEEDDHKILKFLMGCTAEQIVTAQSICSTGSTPFNFSPCIEPYLTLQTVHMKPPMESLKQAWSNKIPVLMGGTSKEGLFWRSIVVKTPEIMEASLKTCTNYVPKSLAKDPNSPECIEKALKLRKLHVAGETPTEHDFYDIVGFSYFWHPIDCTLNARVRNEKHSAATYLYRFDFDSEKLMHPYRLMRLGRGIRGVAHADDLTYLFSTTLAKRMECNSREYRMIQRMIGIWTTFAEYGTPHSVSIDGMKGIQWDPLRPEDETWKCLNIADELKMINLPEMAKLKVWRELYHNDAAK